MHKANDATVIDSKTAAARKAEQVSAIRKEISIRRPIHTKTISDTRLIWLDENIDENCTDFCDDMEKLQSVISAVNSFADADQCIDFLTDILDEKVYMIISGTIDSTVISLIHDTPQLQSIFIYTKQKIQQEQLNTSWFKVNGMFTEITSICDALKLAVKQYEHNSIPTSFVAIDDDLSTKKLDQLEPTFMYSQILKEILLTIQFTQQHFQQFIDYCSEIFDNDAGQLQLIDRLKREYQQKTPIWWYTFAGFLYTMLNRSLRLLNTDLIVRIGFFIKELHQQIEQLHREQFGDQRSNKMFTVYRGQGMDKQQFEKLLQIKGGLFSFNSFLSTSTDRDVSCAFAASAADDPNLVGILFIMKIDPSQSTTPFALVTEVSNFGNMEEEVLFSMHTVFRINEITPMTENQQLFQIELTLTNDNDPYLRLLTDRIREETFSDSDGWFRLGLVLLQLDESKKAEEVYQILLEQSTTEQEKATIYNQIGAAKCKQGDYEESIKYYEKSLLIQQQLLSSDHLDLAACYHNIGIACFYMGEYSKAVSSFEKALVIRQESLPSNHVDLAGSYNNIGMVYYNIGEYSKALLSFEKALAIHQQSLPSNHPNLAASYNSIGAVCDNIGEYPKALLSYRKALTIQQQSLPPNHPSLASSYNNIGSVYYNMSEYSQALSSYQKALAIQEQSLRPNHPDLASAYNNIGLVYDNMGNYSEALASYQKALVIREETLSPNHPYWADSYNNIGLVYSHMDEYGKALVSFERALVIQQESLPSNHPDLAMSYNNIGMVYDNMDEYSKAFLYYAKSLLIQQQSLPSNHPHLAISYNNIGAVFLKMDEYSEALSSFEKALEIRQQSFPSNHPDLVESYNNVGAVCEYMKNYLRARSCYENAVKIAQQSLAADHPQRLMCEINLNRVKNNF